MKTKLIALALLLFTGLGVNAQIDRSQQPKPGPAPEINIGTPETFTLDNGLKVLVVENHKLPRVSMTLTMDNPPHAEGDKVGVASLMGDVLGEGSKNIPKDKFNEEIDFLGANVNFFSSGASARALSKYFPRIMELMADGALHPNFNEEEFQKKKEQTIEGIKSSAKDVASTASKVRTALAYGKDHPYGEFATVESVETLTLNDVKTYYNNYYVPQNAYLVIVGDVDFKDAKKLVEKNFSDWKTSNLPQNNMPEVTNPDKTEIDFVNMPNAVQSEIALVNTIKLKMKDEDYFPVLLANKILGGGGEARLFLNLREDKGYTYGAYSRTGDDKYASTFIASASVRNAVTDSSVVAFLDEINRIRDTKVSEEELENAKSKFTGDFVLSLEQPSTIARFALNVETEDLSEDFYQNYLKKINAVTAEDVQRVAKKYFQVANERIVVVGKASEVLKGLKNFTYKGKQIPINYYDRFADTSQEPEMNKEVDPGMTAQKVFDKYLQAIGGKQALENVESVYMKAKASIQGQQLDMEMKNTKKGQSMVSVGSNGMVLSKQVFNGENGYIMQQGQKMDYNDEQKEAAKNSITPFTELNAEGAELTRMEQVDGKDAYVISIGEDREIFYDKASGLRVKAVKTVTQNGQSMTVPTLYSNYKEVEGIKFPFTISQSLGPQTLDFEVTDIQLNKGVSEADFE